MLHIKKHPKKITQEDRYITPTFASRELKTTVPKYTLPSEGMPAQSAYQIVHDELMLDGNSRLNLATFVTTWMEPEAQKLMAETMDKNMIDKDEYPQTAEIEMRCVNILSHLYNSPDEESCCGCSTVGSSEAVMLAGMAFLWKWRERMKEKNKPIDTPNLVMGIDVQICWEKFCRYWNIEPRYIPMKPGKYTITPAEVEERIDENTIGVAAILGTTFTGQYEDIKDVNDMLEKYNSRSGNEIPLHVDAASGGFIAPFIQPELEWDFRLKWVKSINTSGHKYGLVYPGVGWVLWRTKDDLPKDLVFDVNYLGGDMPTFTLNFSRPGNQVVAQYYNFLRLGYEGYRDIQNAARDTALYLADKINALPQCEIITNGSDIPVLTFTVNVEYKDSISVFDISEAVRHRGWLIPAYTLPANAEDIALCRIVVKEGFSRDMADMLVDDMKRALTYLLNIKDRVPRKDIHKGTKVRKHC